jgi:hypothetical protein
MDQLIDPLAEQLPREDQIQAARLAQDGFAHSFRLTLETAAGKRQKAIAEAAKKLYAWAVEPADTVRSSLRMGMLLSGLDQWGVAYSQIIGAPAMAGLSDLVSLLRSATPDNGAAATESIAQMNDVEARAFTFKAELRKTIHLALWHAMIEEQDRENAKDILRQLGGMMLRLLESTPDFGWITIAHTLADIQIRCLVHNLATTGLGQEMTQELFGALNQQLPAEQIKKIMSGATQTVIAWQQSARSKTSH